MKETCFNETSLQQQQVDQNTRFRRGSKTLTFG